jgi:uncharacterized protein
MILEFSAENFLSIKDSVTLSLEAAAIRERESENVISASGFQVLKGAVIYGGNGSGKSNLVKAIKFVDRFIRDSSKDKQQGEPIGVEPFRLSTETEAMPCSFEVKFLVKNVWYRYGFSVDSNKVVEEYLFSRSRPASAERELFSRDGQDIKAGAEFDDTDSLASKTRDNALFLSVCAQFNHAIASELVEHWTNVHIITSTADPHIWRQTLVCAQILGKSYEDRLSRLLQLGDIGISGIDWQRLKSSKERPEDDDSAEQRARNFMDDRFEVSLSHPRRDSRGQVVDDVLFDLFKNESEGTRKLFGLGGVIILVLGTAGTLIVDEFDARLHPLLTTRLVRLFNSASNVNGAQLVIVTHDTNLLTYGHYRRDQIWFTEKSEGGATDLYSLVEYRTDEDQKIRKDASFEKDYIAGRYGGIPYLGDFESLMESTSSDVIR